MKTRLPASASSVVLVAALAGPRAVAGEPPALADAPKTTVDAQTGISETVFPNGLTLLVWPRPEDPVVSTQIWYRVGSRDEDRGETGLSHFLEHMLFKGTDKYAKGDIDKATQEGGGRNNASTSYDFTEYHFTFPADTWERALEIESNRMRNSAFLEDEFEAERQVVLQELKMNHDDPADVLYESVNSTAFRVNGYHHPVLGWEEEVRAVPRGAVKAFYLRHYTPDRATLVIVGGVDRERAIERVGALFGPIARGDVRRREISEPAWLGETRLTLHQDTEVSRVILAFRSMPVRDPDEPALDLIQQVLADGKASRLVRRLVDGGLAADVHASNDSRRDDGLFEIVAQANPDRSLDEIEAAVREELARLVEEGPTPAEVALARAKVLASRAFARESAERLAGALGYLSTTVGWRYYLEYPARIEAATPESVRAVAKRVFDPKRVVVARSVPMEGEAPGEEGGGEGSAGGGGGSGGAAGGGHRREPEEKGALGRRFREEPVEGSALVSRALDLRPLRVVLDNGLTVVALRRTGAPVLSASLLVKDGRLGEALPGLDAFAGSLLEEGTKTRTGPEIAEQIGAVGGSLWAGASSGVRVLSKDAALGLHLLADVVRNPLFAPDAIERVRDRQQAAIEEERDTPRRVATLAFHEKVYGEGHPLGRSAYGTEETVASIDREDLVAHHARFFTPGNAILAVVSDLEPEAAVALAKQELSAWTGAAPQVTAPPIPAPRALAHHVPLDRRQANLFLGHVGIARDDPDFAALEVFENVFGTGAGFTDRLSKNIRDERGLAYTVFGNVTGNAGRLPGTLRMFAGVDPEKAGLAVAEMRRELARALVDPPTAEEIRGAKAALRGGMVFRSETSSDLADLLLLCERFRLGFDYPRRYVEEIAAITPEQVVAAAKRRLRPDALVEVIVGPPESFRPAGAATPEAAPAGAR
jgi:zinc protease